MGVTSRSLVPQRTGFQEACGTSFITGIAQRRNQSIACGLACATRSSTHNWWTRPPPKSRTLGCNGLVKSAGLRAPLVGDMAAQRLPWVRPVYE